MPIWMKELLLNKDTKKIIKKNKSKETNIEELFDIEFDEEDNLIEYSPDDIETLVNMLSTNRCDDYDDWVKIGMCLYNLNPKLYLFIWRKWSRKSQKYFDGDCEKKWKSFKKTKDGITIRTLLCFAKIDSPEEYNIFMKRKKLTDLIVAKFPDDKLILGDTRIVSDKCSFTHIHDTKCLIKGGKHDDMPNSMYVEMLDKFMSIKCKHPECFGKIYPCEHHIQLTKQEMNIYGDVTININGSKDDELVEFQKINIYEDEKLNELVFNSLNGESYSLAEIIYHYYENTFNYGEDENWYMYKDHKWHNMGKKIAELRNMTQYKLKELYNQLISYYKQNDNDKKKINTVKGIIKSFDNTSQKNNIMIELAELFTINKNKDRDFTQNLDSDNHLIGFNNGVYDLNTFEFRDGTPEDFITMSVGYDYSEKKTTKYKELIQFLEDIQPEKTEREYMLTYLSIGLLGNMLELFTILTGCGRNGKSKLVELLKITLGDYFGSVQSQLFTRPRPDANSPDPGLLSLSKKRVVIASEPEKNSKLNSGFIKFITGRDSTTLRNCHSNDMVEFTANFITLLICNDIPDCDDIDNAFSKRLRCINFPTEFVLEPTKENQKKINTSINENFKYWKMDFMHLLIEYYIKYTKNKELKPTENILKWTNNYKEDTDIYLSFLNECTEDSDSNIKTTILYDCFKEWYKINNPHAKIPNNRGFCNGIKKYKTLEKVSYEGKSVHGIKKLKLKDQN